MFNRSLGGNELTALPDALLVPLTELVFLCVHCLHSSVESDVTRSLSNNKLTGLSPTVFGSQTKIEFLFVLLNAIVIVMTAQ